MIKENWRRLIGREAEIEDWEEVLRFLSETMSVAFKILTIWGVETEDSQVSEGCLNGKQMEKINVNYDWTVKISENKT